MSEQLAPPEETISLKPPEKINPARELWRSVVLGKGETSDGTPRRRYTDEELKSLAAQIEAADRTENEKSRPEWIQKYGNNGVPTKDLLADLNAEAQRRLSSRAAVAETEVSQAVAVAVEDNVRTAEQGQQIEELRRQLLAANLQMARLTEANTRLFQRNRDLGEEVKRLRPPEPAAAAQVKVASKGFLDRIFGGKKEPVVSATVAAEIKDKRSQVVPAASERPVQWTEKMSPAELLELREEFTEGEVVTETGRKLRVGPFLKAGLIGAVYPAIDEEGRRYAIKFPAANLSADALVRFNEETAVIERFYKSWKLRYPNAVVPFSEVIKLTSVQHRSKEVNGAFALEWFPEESLLFSHLPPREQGLAWEAGLTTTAVDYSRMLEVLNQDLHISCRDRKTTDLRLRGDRLVVLDWNVTRNIEGRDPNYGKLHPDDVYLFGSLWYQMAAGRYPPVIINPLNESQWHESVSYQMRFLLAKCLSPVAAERTSGSLVTEVEEMQKRLNEDPKVLLEEGLKKLKPVKWAASSAGGYLEQMRRLEGKPTKELKLPNIDDAREALIYLDLARRKGLPDAEQPYQDAVLLLRKNIPDLAIGQAAHHFNIIQYGLMKKALEAVEPLSRGNPQLRLRWARWQQLERIGNAALQAGIPLRPHREEILSLMKALEAGDWLEDSGLTGFQQSLGEITAGMPEGEVKSLFGNLNSEILLRQSLTRAHQAEASGDFTQAALEADRALETLKSFASQENNPYLSSLLEFVPLDRLESEAAEFGAMARVQEGIKRWQEAFEKTKEDVTAAVPEEFRQLDIVLLSRQLEALGRRLPATAQENLNRMREQLGVLRDLSFALDSADFARATSLIDGLR